MTTPLRLPQVRLARSTANFGACASPPAPSTPRQPSGGQLRRPSSVQNLQNAPRTPYTPSLLASSARQTGQTYRGHIHVGVRVKPEATRRGGWVVNSAARTIRHATTSDLVFDEIYDETSTNEQVFEGSVKSLITRVVEGFNATVFTYGITGSGKTWTMVGDSSDLGIIPQSVLMLFELLEQSNSNGFTVKLSYLEIYNERVFDLLAGGTSPFEVMLRDDRSGVNVVGLTEVTVDSPAQLFAYTAAGDQLRRTSSTEYNERSSRSHAVLQLSISAGTARSILSLCDLAGSEPAVVEAERRNEGKFINKSLLTLGTVMNILSQHRETYVPYRDSKLTRLLQPSLSGQALVAVLCTLQTSPSTITESLNTLRFAARAKNVVVSAQKHTILEDAGTNEGLVRLVEEQQREIAHLRDELRRESSLRSDLQEQLDIILRGNEGAVDGTVDDRVNDGNLERSLEYFAKDDEDEDLREQANLDRLENQRLRARLSELMSEMSELGREFGELRETSKPGAVAALEEAVAELRARLEDKEYVIRYYREAMQQCQKMDSMMSVALPSPANSPDLMLQ